MQEGGARRWLVGSEGVHHVFMSFGVDKSYSHEIGLTTKPYSAETLYRIRFDLTHTSYRVTHLVDSSPLLASK